MTASLVELERQSIFRLIEKYSVMEAGQQVLLPALFVYDICRMDNGWFVPREEAKGNITSFKPFSSEEEELLLLYREMKREGGVWAEMREGLCALLNEYDMLGAGCLFILSLMRVYEIPLPK